MSSIKAESNFRKVFITKNREMIGFLIDVSKHMHGSKNRKNLI